MQDCTMSSWTDEAGGAAVCSVLVAMAVGVSVAVGMPTSGRADAAEPAYDEDVRQPLAARVRPRACVTADQAL